MTSSHQHIEFGAVPVHRPPQQIRLCAQRHDWSAFATSLGVAARRVERLDDLADAVSEASQSNGPFLIELSTGVFPAPNRYYTECAACP
ncbi:hypothetical protein A6V36_12015 [Paraburkholderia ginsengiterrae]|uniref:Thiamine pyrophosphate enzyme TPP-binding domain-containing protein n=1 Tax=Paraburkholderia ginsengiterrae TaxID=1462993 RepID=A0A1A9N2D2_9BURK|nr:hypothetical protein A6V36_12015 [Paraburkholderia ginsengiterrae]OAJ55782.1 hypothetical protein A6V37_06080 [Paraburkholderia ginsengiterrae]